MSRKLQEIKMDLNAHVLDAINLAIAEKVLPTIQNAFGIGKKSFGILLLLMQNWTFGQTDCIRAKLAKWLRNGTLSQMDCIKVKMAE